MDGASVYILRCGDGIRYVGVTQRSLDERVSEYNSGLIPGYTSRQIPVTLLFSEAYPRVDEAIAAEKRIKEWSRQEGRLYPRRFRDA